MIITKYIFSHCPENTIIGILKSGEHAGFDHIIYKQICINRIYKIYKICNMYKYIYNYKITHQQ